MSKLPFEDDLPHWPRLTRLEALLLCSLLLLPFVVGCAAVVALLGWLVL